MRRLVVAGRVTTRAAPQGEEGDAQTDRCRRDGAGDKDSAGMPQLAARHVADRSHQVSDRAVGGQSRREAGLEARPDGQRAKRGPHDRGSVDQRRQLRPHGKLASGQKAVDGLIEAFGGRAC